MIAKPAAKMPNLSGKGPSSGYFPRAAMIPKKAVTADKRSYLEL
jgi:hypothetical protein